MADQVFGKAVPAARNRRSPLAFRFDLLTWSATSLLLIILLGVAAPLIAPHDPNAVELLARSKPPFWLDGGTLDHPLGTDNIGRICCQGVSTVSGRVSESLAGAHF
jgi:ABC-type dipeptide/oligopeptide/nickel transport system permease subunit